MEKKRKPTSEEYEKMRVLYLKGMKPRFIVEKFKHLDINAKDLSSRFSRSGQKKKKDQIKEKVEKKLLETLEQQQEKANKKLVEVSSKIIDVVSKYLESKQYNDFTTFSYGSFVKKSTDTLNALAFAQVVKAVLDAQKMQRLALGMDEKEQNQDLPQPVINIDFGENKK